MLGPPSNSLKNMAKAEGIKMLTPSDIKKIKNFENLEEGHKRTFKHRLRFKCISAIKDVQYVLANYEKLNTKPDKFVDVNEVINLLDQYENLCLLQNM